jgi:hypothetical protein
MAGERSEPKQMLAFRPGGTSWGEASADSRVLAVAIHELSSAIGVGCDAIAESIEKHRGLDLSREAEQLGDAIKDGFNEVAREIRDRD